MDMNMRVYCHCCCMLGNLLEVRKNRKRRRMINKRPFILTQQSEKNLTLLFTSESSSFTYMLNYFCCQLYVYNKAARLGLEKYFSSLLILMTFN